MKKIIMFEGDIETQSYFSYQMRDRFLQLGHQVYTYDLAHNGSSMSGLLRFIEKGNTVVVCFNFHGLTPGDLFQDEEDGHWMWDDMEIPCINIVVDHPFYYHKFLAIRPKYYIHVSIDRFHDAYMKRFFPDVLRVSFLPLAGTQIKVSDYVKASDLTEKYQQIPAGMEEKAYIDSLLTEEGYLPLDARPVDIVFTGNYSNPKKFDKYIERLGEEYAEFYRGIIAELLEHPDRTLEDVAEAHIRADIPDVTEAQLKETMPNLIFLDLYVRSVIRGAAVRALADAGLKVKVYGDGWDELELEHPENILDEKGVNSLACLKAIALAKVSLNVMPWFKDGAHDRIFNTVLNGSLTVTDDSIYLKELFTSGENCVLYSYDQIEKMPELVKTLLEHPDRLQEVIKEGYYVAAGQHTWAQRAEILSELMEQDDFM